MPSVTPLMVFYTWLWESANSSQFFSVSPHLSPRSLFSFFPRRLSSILIWQKSICRIPLGPFTVMVHPFWVMSTFWGMSHLTDENGFHFCSRCGKEMTKPYFSSISSVEWKHHEGKDLYCLSTAFVCLFVCLSTALYWISRKLHDKQMTWSEY